MLINTCFSLWLDWNCWYNEFDWDFWILVGLYHSDGKAGIEKFRWHIARGHCTRGEAGRSEGVWCIAWSTRATIPWNVLLGVESFEATTTMSNHSFDASSNYSFETTTTQNRHLLESDALPGALGLSTQQTAITSNCHLLKPNALWRALELPTQQTARDLNRRLAEPDPLLGTLGLPTQATTTNHHVLKLDALCEALGLPSHEVCVPHWSGKSLGSKGIWEPPTSKGSWESLASKERRVPKM